MKNLAARLSTAPLHTGIRLILTLALLQTASAQNSPSPQPADTDLQARTALFEQHVQPLLARHCTRCHNADKMTSGIRVDQLAAVPEDRHLALLADIRRQIDSAAMPPEDEPPIAAEERSRIIQWIDLSLRAARDQGAQKNGAMRRLTIAQYRNSLQDLLGIQEDLTDSLPADAISKDGFTNNAALMTLSPLQSETWFEIAQRALDQCIVDESAVPVIQTFRMDLGRNINPDPCPDNLILGANSELIPSSDFLVTELAPHKPFRFQPWQMQRSFDFIEGYVGNDTIRQWRHFDGLAHSVFACVRGNPGYPRGAAWETTPAGLLLRPAIPGSEIFGESTTYGPRANFKISLRELPLQGNFRITVNAAAVDDGLLLTPDTPISTTPNSLRIPLHPGTPATLSLNQSEICQICIIGPAAASGNNLQLLLGTRDFSTKIEGGRTLPELNITGDLQISPLLTIRLPAGQTPILATLSQPQHACELLVTPLTPELPQTASFLRFEARRPWLGVHLGLRRDCGSTLTPVGLPVEVRSHQIQQYVFNAAITDFPAPEVEKNNVNYLAGVREIGVRSEYTDGRDLPRLNIQSVQFEGPYFETWPPRTHRTIFFDSPLKPATEILTAPFSETSHALEIPYARQILARFASKAWRRTASEQELQLLVSVWASARRNNSDFFHSIKDSLLVVLTSPAFLFIIEDSHGPEPEPLAEHELAAKLAFFLWNSPPDQHLTALAENGTLRQHLHSEIDRMIDHPHFFRFISEFAPQWLNLDRFDVLAVDERRFPHLNRTVRSRLRLEPAETLAHLIRRDRPVTELVHADYILADDAVATYYGLTELSESGFTFTPVPHKGGIGGLLTQAAVLAGLSNGREPNPIKRGAWLARRIIAEPPADPPPNVPQLPESADSSLTLRQKLEAHRDQPGCAKCHSGIDPWGLPFEQYDASGRRRTDPVDAASALPDGTAVDGVDSLKQYLATDRVDQITFNLIKHLATWANGRSLAWTELELLQTYSRQLTPTHRTCRRILHDLIDSPLFLTK
jgi:hypothetical protein